MNAAAAANTLPLACSVPPGTGEPARERLLHTSLRLFAERGYARTSIRQIAQTAGVNVAAVSYYFGSKAGLYRAVFWGTPAPDTPPARTPAPVSVLPEWPVASLERLYQHLLEPLKSGQGARHWIQLHRREMLEPTGLWKEKVDRGMQPMHVALVDMLCHELGLAAPDDEVQALAIQLIAPAVHLLVNCEVVDVVAPHLLAGAAAVDAWQARLLRGALALIEAERQRRASAPAATRHRSSRRRAEPVAARPKKRHAPPQRPPRNKA